MSTSIDQVLDLIGNMTVLELSELKKQFEDKFGVTAAAPMMPLRMVFPLWLFLLFMPVGLARPRSTE